MRINYWDQSPKGKIKLICKKRDVKVGHFKNCTIDGHSLHYPQPLLRCGDELILPTIERFMSLNRGTIYEENMELEPRQVAIDKIEKNPVFYFVYNCANYFHWIYDTVPYLYHYINERKNTSNLKLLINVPENKEDLYPFVYETLSLLGIAKSDLVFLQGNTQYNKVIIGSSLTHNRASLLPPHKGLYSVLRLMRGSKSNEKYIYISRRTWSQPSNNNIGSNYTQERKCVNEDEVALIFRERGFKEIFCENLSMKDKIGLFENARFVAGPSGGGMANVLFCKASTTVLSINDPDFFTVNKRLEHALSHTRLHHFNSTRFVDKKPETKNKNSLSVSGGPNSPWEVDLKKLKKFLTTI